jgi:predicted metal-dependent HD superfamily phosphohydrolase
VPEIADLLESYRSPGRHYHTLRHLTFCLRELDGLRARCASPDAVETALWYHDAVYDPTRTDNEQHSAGMAAEAMVLAGVAEPFIQHVKDLILQTQHTAIPTDKDAQVLVDIDLAILGQPAEAFEAYEHAIRREYHHVDESAYRLGRSAVLQQFLDRPAIYSTAPMKEKYEKQARIALGRAIENLTRF